MRPPRGKSGGNAGKAKTKQTKSKQQNTRNSDDSEADATDFHSPSVQDDLTDYGLEFSTSRLTLGNHNGQARNSTLRGRKQQQPPVTAQIHSQQEVMDAPTDYEDEDDDNDADEEDQENRPPNTQERPVHASGRVSENRGQTNQVSRRKQSRPINRNRRLAKEMLRLQSTPDLLIPRLPFSRLVREVLAQYSGVHSFKITTTAFEALQHSSEMFLTQRFQDSYLLTMHRQRVTLEVRDMALMAFLCKESVN